jgi:hypothetical protein
LFIHFYFIFYFYLFIRSFVADLLGEIRPWSNVNIISIATLLRRSQNFETIDFAAIDRTRQDGVTTLEQGHEMLDWQYQCTLDGRVSRTGEYEGMTHPCVSLLFLIVVDSSKLKLKLHDFMTEFQRIGAEGGWKEWVIE